MLYASVAQLVEQGTENPRVVGSIPTGGTIADLAHLVERDLAKVEVAGSSPVIRSRKKNTPISGVFFFSLWSELRGRAPVRFACKTAGRMPFRFAAVVFSHRGILFYSPQANWTSTRNPLQTLLIVHLLTTQLRLLLPPLRGPPPSRREAIEHP